MDKNFNKTFDQCPVCGSKERFFENLLQTCKEKGYIAENAECFDFQLLEGTTLSSQKLSTMPFGVEFPTFKHIHDTCCECGAVYATRLHTGTARKSLEIPKGSPKFPPAAIPVNRN